MPGADRLGLERSAADPPGEDRSGLEPLAIDLLAEEPLGLAPSGANLSSAPQRADPAPWDPELRIQPPGHEPEQGGDGIGGDNTARQDSTIHHDLVAADLAVAGKKEAGLAEVELVDSSSGVAAIDASLRARNLALKAAGLRLRLERRGPWLGLRGPLPYRRGSDNSSGSESGSGSGGVKVQRLSLGLPANAAGLLEAEARLHLLQQQLAEGSFAWLQGPAPATAASAAAPSPAVLALAGRPTAGQPGPIPVSAGPIQASAAAAPPAPSLLAALEAFELAFFADPRRRRQPAGSRSTWRAAYRPYLRRLLRLAPERAELCQELLLQVLESYELASRSRQQCGIALAALASHRAIPLPGDWRERSGGYGLHVARFRQLPLDSAILALVERIPNPRWRLAYGLMATYGLRNHEVFFSDLSALAPGGDRVLRVLPTSKTGEHQVWPFQPEWVERFELERLGGEVRALPVVATDLRRTTLQQVGRRVAEQFRRYDLPITPYDLRHAWAVRTIHIGLPDTVAARMMGHSVAIHTRTYHHWITRRDQQQAVDAALARMRGA